MLRTVRHHFELVLTLAGLLLVGLVAAIAVNNPALGWPVVAVTAAIVAVFHALLFRIIRRRREAAAYRRTHQQQVRDRLLIATQHAFTRPDADSDLMPRLAELAVIEFADWCTIFIATPTGQLQRVALATNRDDAEAIRAGLWNHHLRADAPVGYPAVIRSGTTEFLPEVPADYFDAAYSDPVHRALTIQMQPRSSLTVPLALRESGAGAVTFVRCGTSPAYTLADQVVAEEWGQQVARALDHASLTQRTRRQFEELDTLRQLARLMVNNTDLQAIVVQVVEQIHQTLGYPFVSVFFLQENTLLLQHQVGYETCFTQLDLQQSASGRAVRTGQTVFSQRAADDTEFVRPIPEIEQGIFVPLRQRDGVIFGVLLVESTGTPYLTSDDVALLELLADHIGVAFGFAFASKQLAELELALRAERGLFTQGPVVVLRRGLSPGWPIVYVSTNVSQFGYDAADLIQRGAAFSDMLNPDDVHRVAAEIDACARSGRASFEQEYRIQTADGETRWVSDVTLVRRDAAGLPTHFDGYLIDISARVAAAELQQSLERQLLGAHKLESLGMLAAGVAHDFNNLLTVIVGNAGMLAHTLPRESNAQESVAHIQLAARRASELTQQILTYAGKGRFLATAVQLNTIVAEAADLCRTMLAANITFTVHLAADLPLINGDSAQIHQIAMNLLVNAADALADRAGAIVVRTERQEVHEHRTLGPGTYVVLIVQDTGVGMDDATRERMFDPFFSTKPTGRGLGLAAVLGIVRQHEGTIEVQSVPNVGTTLTVSFPASPLATVGSEPPQFEADAVPPVRAGSYALVIDDEPAVRTTLTRMLDRLGYQVVAAESGPAGIAAAHERAGAFDIVFLDVTMPEMSGVEVRKHLRTAYAQLPIVLMSGYTTLDLGAAMAADPQTTFLPKPFLGSDLQKAIATLRLRSEATRPSG